MPRKRNEARRPHFDPSPERKQALATRFFASMLDGNNDSLVAMLSEDAVIVVDRRGKGGAISGPGPGGLQIAHFLAGLGRQDKRLDVQASPATVNGQPGAIMHLPAERVVSSVALEKAGNQIGAIRAVVDPEKLQHVRGLA